MTASLILYQLPRVITLALSEGTIMHYPVNHSSFKLFRGVTNHVLFFVKDIDNQIVTPITPPKIIINTQENDIELSQKEFTQETQAGLWRLTYSPEEVEAFPIGPYKYSVVVDNGLGEVPLYTDKGYGPRGICEVHAGPYAVQLDPYFIDRTDMYFSNGVIYSSSYKSAENMIQTGNHVATVDVVDFVGNVVVEGSHLLQPSQNRLDWKTVYMANVVDETSNSIDIAFPEGGYKWIRFSAVENQGNVVSFSYNRYLD